MVRPLKKRERKGGKFEKGKDKTYGIWSTSTSSHIILSSIFLLRDICTKGVVRCIRDFLFYALIICVLNLMSQYMTSTFLEYAGYSIIYCMHIECPLYLLITIN